LASGRGSEEPLTSLPLTEAVSAWTHLLGAAGAALMGAQLVRRGRDREQRVALAIYVGCAVAMFLASGVYHLAGEGHPLRGVLQRIDHSGIWLQIAGTFTPIHIVFFRGFWRWFPLVVVWTGAALGVALKLFFFDTVPEAPGLFLYLALGWFGMASVVRMALMHGLARVLPIFLGGVWYSAGALLELSRWPTLWPGAVGPHQLFHLLVIAGVIHHWSFIQRWAGTDFHAPPELAPIAAVEPTL
jgi:channel protein (hemolysin III family)